MEDHDEPCAALLVARAGSGVAGIAEVNDVATG